MFEFDERKAKDFDFLLWMVIQLEEEVARLGIIQQAVIKIGLPEQLEGLSSGKAMRSSH